MEAGVPDPPGTLTLTRGTAPRSQMLCTAWCTSRPRRALRRCCPSCSWPGQPWRRPSARTWTRSSPPRSTWPARSEVGSQLPCLGGRGGPPVCATDPRTFHASDLIQWSFKKNNFFLMFIFERENVHAHASGGGQRERERGGLRIQSRLCADGREPDTGLDLAHGEIMT